MPQSRNISNASKKNVSHGGFEVDLYDFHDLFPEKKKTLVLKYSTSREKSINS